MIGMVGLMDDCAKNARAGFAEAGHKIALVGGAGAGHSGGSEYLRAVHGKIAGLPPPLDFAKEKAVQKAVRDGVRAGAVKAAHDCSDGGLAVALAEMCFPNELGCRVAIKSALRPDALLFGEDASRILISYAEGDRARIEAICKAAGAPFEEIGQVGGASMVIEYSALRAPPVASEAGSSAGLLEARVAELLLAWSAAIPRLVGEGIHKAALETTP